MISAICFFLILVIPPFFFAVRRGKRFEETAAVSAGAIILFLFLCGFLENLALGVYIVIGLAFFLLCASVYLLTRPPRLRRALPFFTPAFFAFAAVYVFLIILHRGRLVYEWDALAHWGDVVKAMSFTDALSSDADCHCLFPSYPPGMALFQYLFEKLAMLCGEGFADGRLYVCYHLLAFLFLLPFFTVRKARRALPVFVLFLCVAVLPAFLQAEYLATICIDAFLGLLAGSGFAMLYVKKRTPLMTANLLAVCSLLVLTKDIGLLFAVMLGLGFVLREFRQGAERKKLLVLSLLTAASVAVPKLLWEISLRLHQTTLIFRDPIDWGALFRVLTLRDDSYRAAIFGAFFRRFFTSSVPLHGGTGLSLGYPLLTVLLLFMLYALGKLCAAAAPEKEEPRALVRSLLTITLVLYIVAMPFLYMFRFSQYEAENLASFDRYLSIVYDCVLIALFLIFVSFVQKRPRWTGRGLFLCLLAALLALEPGYTARYISRESVTHSHQTREPYTDVIAAMRSVANGEKKRVWIIAQGKDGECYLMLHHEIRPCDAANAYLWSLVPTLEDLAEDDIYSTPVTPEDWLYQLQDYDCVLLYIIDDAFRENYASVFENPEDIGPERIFTVDHERDLLVRVS